MANISDFVLIESYKKHQSIRKVGLELGISHETARYKLKKLGVLNKPIVYTCNEDFFAQYTPESFYWAGFIAADGCVKLKDGKYKQLSIGLAIKDAGHVEKFKKAINFNGITYISKCKDISVGICISSDKLFDDLARFNIVPRKSLVLVFPEWLIEHPLVNHFMRGYNDGDGSFYISKLNRGRIIKQISFSLRGTKQFLTKYKELLEKYCNLISGDKSPRLNCGIYILGYGGNRKVIKIRDFLYKNSTPEIRLDRKYDKSHSEDLMNIPKDYKLKKVEGTNIATGEIITFNSMKETADVGFTRSMVSSCCRGVYKSHKNYTWNYA